MAFANSAVSDIIATNIQSRSGELADNVTNNNALLRRLKERGNVKTFSGGNVILQEIMYNDASSNNTNSYSGYEVLNVAQNSPISAAQFGITQYASAVTISGLEMIQNSGKEAIIDLLDGRMAVAEAQLQNRMSGDIYLDGTGNAGKNITGLGAAVPDVPTSGTYGGINRATWAFWQTKSFSGVTNGGSAVSPFRPHVDRNFVPIGGERQAVNQDAIVKLIGWAGNMTCSGSQFQGVLIA